MGSAHTVKFDYDSTRRQGLISGDHFDEIRERFSVPNDAAKFARYRNRFTPTRKYVITPQGRFDPGLYYDIRKFIRDNAPDTKIHTSDTLKEVIKPGYSEVFSKDRPELNLELRDYQSRIVDECLRFGRGVTILATAGGKTLTIASLIESVYREHRNLKCLIIVPDLGLVNQTYSDFREYGTTFLSSRWTGSNELNLSSNVIIANTGILQSSKSDVEWTQDIDLLIIDEVHKLRRDNKINKIIKKIRTPKKFGFTGTMPEQRIDQWNIVGKIGPVLYERNSFQLRKDQYVANASIQVLKLEYNDKPPSFPKDRYDPIAKFRREQEFLAKSKFRNGIISKLAKKFDNNSLIMVDHIAHGEELYGILRAECKDKQVFFIRGDVPIEDRDKVKKLMEKEKNLVCIAISKIFSTGINIKNLHYIVFASGGKAKVKIIQSIGRGLRLHKDKEGVIIIDIADKLKYSYQHYMKRIKLYKSERIKYGVKTITEEGKEESEEKR